MENSSKDHQSLDILHQLLADGSRASSTVSENSVAGEEGKGSARPGQVTAPQQPAGEDALVRATPAEGNAQRATEIPAKKGHLEQLLRIEREVPHSQP